MTTLHYVGIGVGAAIVLNGLNNMRLKKGFFSMPSLGDSEVYQGDYSVKTSAWNRRGKVRGDWTIQGVRGGLSSHQVRFGEAARGCGGRGLSRKQFRSCMSKSLK